MPRHISEENFNVKRHMHPKVTEVLFTIAKTWRKPKCLLPDEQIRKMWYIHVQWNITQP